MFSRPEAIGVQGPLDVAPVLPDGSLNERLLRAAASEPLTRQRRDERFWFTYLPDSRTVYASFRGYDSLGEHARDLYKLVDSQPTDRLIIDMRQNGGGDFFKGRKHMIEPLKERPGLNQKGKVFVAVGRQIRPFRVVSIRLVAPFERVHQMRSEGESTMSFSTNTTTWVVHAEGTFRDCASTCAIYWAAILVVEDARGAVVGRDPAGPTSLEARPTP